jgi:SNF2 family DNA or RNA helicase
VKERNKIFQAFQASQRDPRVLVAHPKCMSHGLTLVEAATIVWWAPITSNDIYNQANARITRQGQTRRTTIIHLTATAVEREAFKRLELRQNMQGMLQRLVEKQGRL